MRTKRQGASDAVPFEVPVPAGKYTEDEVYAYVDIEILRMSMRQHGHKKRSIEEAIEALKAGAPWEWLAEHYGIGGPA